jgi:phenylacetate-CoA ligase
MLKYAFGDLLQVFIKECPACGFKGYRGSVVGRVDEMLIIKGVNVYPTAVKGVINSFIPRITGEMRIILDKPGPAVDPPMKISIECGKGINEDELALLKKEIEDRLHAQLEFRAEVTFVPPQTFERAGGVSAKGTLIEKNFERP